MLVYHGSPNNFDRFDYSRIRTNGTSEGVGFYFTDNKSIATGYGQKGYLYTVELKGNKALSDNYKTITENELKKLMIALDDETDYLSNYGDVNFEGYENVLNTALQSEYNNCDTDTEILGSLYNSCGENEIVVTLFYELLGYDYIKSIPEWGNQTLYIALTNDIIEVLEIESL